MADKLTSFLLAALTRAAAEPLGLPLHATKTEPGLFPPVAAAKPAALKGVSEGYFHVVRTDVKGKQARDLYAATDSGLKFLLDHASPKQVLEDLVRTLEERRAEVGELLATAARMAASLDGLSAVVSGVLPKVEAERFAASGTGNAVTGCREQPTPSLRSGFQKSAGVALLEPVTTAELGELVLTRLRDWADSAGVPRDCPLPELFRSLSTLEPPPTVGQFHDALRQLHADGRVYLHPWTGPLYALPEPPVALLVGHEIAFYASLR